MSKPLTKNARWIVVWMRFKDKDTDMFKPQELVMNLGRHSWEVTEEQAFRKHVDMGNDILLAHATFLVDVDLFPYSKQHEEVTRLAEEYFRKRRVTRQLERLNKEREGNDE